MRVSVGNKKHLVVICLCNRIFKVSISTVLTHFSLTRSSVCCRMTSGIEMSNVSNGQPFVTVSQNFNFLWVWITFLHIAVWVILGLGFLFGFACYLPLDVSTTSQDMSRNLCVTYFHWVKAILDVQFFVPPSSGAMSKMAGMLPAAYCRIESHSDPWCVANHLESFAFLPLGALLYLFSDAQHVAGYTDGVRHIA